MTTLQYNTIILLNSKYKILFYFLFYYLISNLFFSQQTNLNVLFCEEATNTDSINYKTFSDKTFGLFFFCSTFFLFLILPTMGGPAPDSLQLVRLMAIDIPPVDLLTVSANTNISIDLSSVPFKDIFSYMINTKEFSPLLYNEEAVRCLVNTWIASQPDIALPKRLHDFHTCYSYLLPGETLSSLT